MRPWISYYHFGLSFHWQNCALSIFHFCHCCREVITSWKLLWRSFTLLILIVCLVSSYQNIVISQLTQGSLCKNQLHLTFQKWNVLHLLDELQQFYLISNNIFVLDQRYPIYNTVSSFNCKKTGACFKIGET